MKKLIFCFLISLLSYSVLAQEYGWTDISANIPGTPDLSDVFFISDNEGWITSSSQAEIYHTIDGGETFEIQTTLFTNQTLFIINEIEGYAGGSSGFVYHTTDGGDNWNFNGTIATTLTDMDFATPTQGYCCGDGGAVFSITPQDVTNLNTGQAIPFSGISSPSADKVYVCGGGSILYYNSETWIFQSGPPGSYNDILFLNDQKGWVVGDSGLLGHTEDGGEYWTRQTNPDPNSLYRVFFLNENVGWTIGTQGTILETTNSGDTWVLDEEGSTLAGTGFLRGIHFTSPTNGYVVGNGNTLLKFSELTSAGCEEIPAEFLHLQNYPNPFNPETTISFSVTQNSDFVNLDVYNIKGQKVKTLINEQMQKGKHTAIWSGVDEQNKLVGSGIYLYKIKADSQESVKRMLLLK